MTTVHRIAIPSVLCYLQCSWRWTPSATWLAVLIIKTKVHLKVRGPLRNKKQKEHLPASPTWEEPNNKKQKEAKDWTNRGLNAGPSVFSMKALQNRNHTTRPLAHTMTVVLGRCAYMGLMRWDPALDAPRYRGNKEHDKRCQSKNDPTLMIDSCQNYQERGHLTSNNPWSWHRAPLIPKASHFVYHVLIIHYRKSWLSEST